MIRTYISRSRNSSLLLQQQSCYKNIHHHHHRHQQQHRHPNTIYKRNTTNHTNNTNHTNSTNSTNSTSSNTASTNSTTTTTSNSNKYKYKQMIPAFTIGTIAGTCGSLAGMGGGFIMIPLMTMTALPKILSKSSNIITPLGLSQHVAHGTSLFAVAATGIAGSISYATSSKKAIQKDSAICITVCAMMTARLGALYSTKLSNVVLKKVLGVFMICVSPVIPLKSYFENSVGGGRNGSSNAVGIGGSGGSIGGGNSIGDIGSTTFDKYKYNNILSPNTKNTILSCGIGLGSGFMAGLLGVGGGAIVVPALTLCTSMDHYTALGTSLAAMVLPAMVGTFTHYKKGNVNLRVAPFLAVGGLVGAYGGGRIGVDIEEDLLRYGFSGLMLTLGIKTVMK